MNQNRYFSYIRQIWQSRLVQQLHHAMQRFASLRWLTERSWKFRVQFLIGVTALFLLIFSFFAWMVYEYEVSKIANHFLRLQIFGPQEIFYVPESKKETSKLVVNFCPFHIETRMPYGGALSGTRIKATFMMPDGTPFWYHSDETLADGTFQLPFPDMPMPEKVLLTIRAGEGEKEAEFRAFLRTSPFPKEITASEYQTERSDNISFHDTPLSAIQANLTASGSSNSHPDKVDGSLQRCLLPTPEVRMSVWSPTEQGTPIFVGVWKDNVLLSCRPSVVRSSTSKIVTLPLPENVSGLLTVLLLDASVTPPRIVKHELAYRLPDEPNLELRQEQLSWLTEYSQRLNTPEFRATEQQIEFLPIELETPTDMTFSPAQIEATDRLLGSALWAKKITATNRYYLPQLDELECIISHLTQCVNFTQEEQKRIAENDDSTNLSVLRQIHDRVEYALSLQSVILNQNIHTRSSQRAYRTCLPVVFDGMGVPEKIYQAELQNFRRTTKNRLSCLACLILCCALCLVFIMLLMSILGLPTDWRIWILTMGVVLFAFLLAWLITNQSDIDRNHVNVRYSIFDGSAQTD